MDAMSGTVPIPTSEILGTPPFSQNVILGKGRTLIKCEICNRTVNSEKQAEAHYNGLLHLSELKKRGMALPAGADVKKLEGFMAVQEGKVSGSSKKNFTQCLGNPKSFRRFPFQEQIRIIPYDENAPLSRNCVKCETCGILLNSQAQSEAHFSGKRHLNRVEKCSSGAALVYSTVDKKPANSSSSSIQLKSSAPENLVIYELCAKHKNVSSSVGPPNAAHRRILVRCEPCDQILNSYSQAETHLKGLRHRKTEKMRGSATDNGQSVETSTPRFQHTCSVCHITVNSAKQKDAHEKGKLHMSKLDQQSSNVCESDACAVTGEAVC